jgi:hypothetical protein
MQGEGVAHHWQPLTPALSLSRGEGFNCRDAGLLKKKAELSDDQVVGQLLRGNLKGNPSKAP